MMYGSSAQFMYDVPFSSDEEEDDHYPYYDGEEEADCGRELPDQDARGEGNSREKGKEKEKDVEAEYYYSQEHLDALLARRLQFGDDPPPERLGAPITEKVALADYLTPTTRPLQEKKGKAKDGEARKKDQAEKRRREAAALQAKFGDLFAISAPAATTKPAGKGGRRSRSRSKNNATAANSGKQPTTDGSAVAEEWTLRLVAGDELLELGFKLSHAYPSVPASVSARLSFVSEKRVSTSAGNAGKKTQKNAQQDEKVNSVADEDDEAHAFVEDEAEQARESTQQREKIDRSLYDSSVVTLLQEQANKGAKVPTLVELARQWLELYAARLAELERKRIAEAQRQAKAEETSRAPLADLRKPAPAMSNFQSWLLRLGLKKQVKLDYLEEVDVEEIFDRKLVERKRYTKRRTVETLWTLCVAAIGDSLLRYESLEGFPLQLRMEVLAYLVSDLRLLYKEHLETLLDSEFVALDFSGLARNGADNKLKDAHLKIVGEKCPRLKEINLTGAVKLKPSGLSDGLSKCHMLSRLNIDDCVKVDDDAMTAVIEGCPLLTFFSARRCPLITHITLYLLGRRCSDLSSVIVAGCVKIALEGVINLTRMSKRLQVLDASEVGNEYSSHSKYYVEPNRLCNQWLNSVTFNRCKRITNGFLRELFGPLPGQVCPNLATVSLRDCPLITNGVIEEVILPACPNLQALLYAGAKKATGVTAVNLNGLSFLEGCNYAFPIRGAKLPVRLQMTRKDLSQNASATANGASATKTPITQAAMRRLVPNPTAFLRSARRFDTNVLARQAMRNLNSLTLATCGFADQYNFLDLIISLPALRYLDVTNSIVQLRRLLLSCYYFLPQLETLICKRNDDLVVVPAHFSPSTRASLLLFGIDEPDAPDKSDRFELREKHVMTKLLLDMHKDQLLVQQQGEQADSAIKRKLWIMQHIQGDDKRYAPRLHTLDVSGHTFGGGLEFADLISNRCPELRALGLANVRGIGDRSLLQLLDQCVHMQSLNLLGQSDHTVTSLRQKKPSLEICRRESW